MPNPSYKPGWQINFIEASSHISADLTPPKSIDDLIESPSLTMLLDCPIGFPTREDAIEALKSRIDFMIKELRFVRRVYEREEILTDEIRDFFDRKDSYIHAASQIVASV